MILKRTHHAVTNMRQAVAWVRGYLDETRKRAGEDLSRMGLGLGRRYFSSRPPGMLTAHGYAAAAVAGIKLARGCGNNQAILEYTLRHCRRQREKKRKHLGIRLVASLDPAKVQLLSATHDLDALLLKSVERTFQELAEKFYPGDEFGFLLGIHHDVNDRLGRPHLHAHLFVLPQTRNGLRISLSNHNCPGRDGRFVDMLDEAREAYQRAVSANIYSLSASITDARATPEWTALAKEYACQTVDDYQHAQAMSAESGRKFAVNRFLYYLRSVEREKLARRMRRRRARLGEPAGIGREEQLHQAWGNLSAVIQTLDERASERVKMVADVLEEYRKSRTEIHVHHSLLETPKSLLLSYAVAPDRVAGLKTSLRELSQRQMAARVNFMGEVANFELIRAALNQPPAVPQWVEVLERATETNTIPSQDLSRAGEPEEPDPPAPIEQPDGVDREAAIPIAAPPAASDAPQARR